MYNPSKPRLGLCCLLHDPINKTTFKTVRKGWAEANPKDVISRLIDTWNNNVRELIRVLNFCEANNIWCYRISSDMFPLADLHPYDSTWRQWVADNSVDLINAQQAIVQFISNGGRLSTHPGQYCVITSDKPHVVDRSLLNLELHASFFDVLMIPRSYMFPINIHLSSGRLESQGANNARQVMDRMTDSLRHRLVFESEDKNYWTYQRIIEHFPQVPVTLDYHHRNINNLGESEEEAHHACVATWTQTYNATPESVRPLFHYTEGAKHALDRSHTDMITKLPIYKDVDLEIEAKHKETAILHAMQWL